MLLVQLAHTFMIGTGWHGCLGDSVLHPFNSTLNFMTIYSHLNNTWNILRETQQPTDCSVCFFVIYLFIIIIVSVCGGGVRTYTSVCT